jgi:hypothetical protein
MSKAKELFLSLRNNCINLFGESIGESFLKESIIPLLLFTIKLSGISKEIKDYKTFFTVVIFPETE